MSIFNRGCPAILFAFLMVNRDCLRWNHAITDSAFTIEDAASGLTVYWEHCGMLLDLEYKKRWDLKQKWYRDNDVLPLAKGGGKNGILVVTSDDPQTGFDTTEIGNIIHKLFGNA
ncbi:MAG TPA: hypothetical protein VMF69_06005 [Gemmataceae bacterium]|nr:hypothetical protein [Gemmataceae bacterium]